MRNALKSCKLICGWGKKGVHEMCDFSLRAVKSRPAKIGDKLTTRGFGTGTRGFAASEDANVAVSIARNRAVLRAGSYVRPLVVVEQAV